MQAAILFVEDNADLRDNATLVLGLEGYAVRAARDGLEALDVLDDGFLPDLIVSDIMMPRMDGYEFFEAVRQRQHLKAIPFIFLTARGSRRDIFVGRSLGADDYLVKPFDPEEFLIAIEKRLERAREITEQATSSLNNARKMLVQVLSHELRTPLTYVTGGFALLAEELETRNGNGETDDVRISLDLIQSGTQRLSRLAEQMVLYSEIISGFVNQQIEEASDLLILGDLVNDALTLLSGPIQEKRVHFRQENPGQDLLAISGVKDLLVMAISEIIRNAVEYSQPEQSIEIVQHREDNMAVLTVIDHGHGIAPENRHNIWDVLIQSGRERNEQQGVGMGLPITKGIVEAHRGDVYLYSEVGRGTKVTIRLPISDEL